MAEQQQIPPDPFFLPPEPESEFHVSQWFDIIRRRRALLLVVVGLIVAIAVLLYAITPKAYRAATIIQIDRRNPVPVGMDQTGYDSGSWYDAESFYPTQYRLLQSRGLAERVVKNLRLIGHPVFDPARARLAAGTEAAASAADDAGVLAGLANRLLGGLGVTPVRNTRLVEVSYVSSDPELAARVANGFVEAFIDWGIETHFANVGRASSFLTSQTDTLKQEIQDKEAQLQAYSRRSDIVALDPASNVTLQRLEALNRDYIAAMSARITAESKYKEIQNAPPEVVAASSPGSFLAQLQAEQARLEREYANKLSTYKPEWPAMQELKAQIDKTREGLEEAVGKARETARSDYQTALRREQTLAGELTNQKSQAMQLNSAAVEYNNLKVEVSTRRALLDELVRKQSETEVSGRLQGARDSNVVVVDRALVPGWAYRPSLSRNLLVGLVLGFGLGLGVVFLIEYLDRTIKTADEVDRILGIPVLAVVPDVSSSRDTYGYGSSYYGRHKSRKPKVKQALRGAEEVRIELLPALKPRRAVSESYRSLRTALLLSTADGLRSVVVTSAVPGEGKTATATNLAVVLAQLGRDVLIVDADLRKPRQHEIFGVSNRVGLVSYLTGQAEAAQVFLRTNLPNLHVAPSGPVPPNPAELLASTRMQEFVTLARQRFDYVVFDTPPALPVTDATILGALVDGVLLCVGAGLVLREDARSCRDHLRLSEVRVLGAALNRYRPGHGRYGKQYRRYEAYVDAYSSEAEAKA